MYRISHYLFTALGNEFGYILKQQELGRPMDQQEEVSDVESHVEFTKKKRKGKKGDGCNTIWVRAPIFKSQLTINISETCAKFFMTCSQGVQNTFIVWTK